MGANDRIINIYSQINAAKGLPLCHMHYALSLRRPTRRRQLLDANQPSSRPCAMKVNGVHEQQMGPLHSGSLARHFSLDNGFML